MADVTLRESAQAVANASGVAVASLQPLRAFESWHVTRWSVASTSSASVPTAKVYRGDISPMNLIEGTFSGNLDSSDTVVDLGNGERLMCVWESADPGSSCTFTVGGEVKRAVY